MLASFQNLHSKFKEPADNKTSTELVLSANLEVYDHCKHKDGGDEVHKVGQVLSVEGLSQGTHLVCAGGQQMEESNDGSLKLSA